MTLLLLLSALLSALTGAGAGARAPQLAVAVTRQVEAQAEDVANEVAAGFRPAVRAASPVDVAFMPTSAWHAALTPLGFGERRRE